MIEPTTAWATVSFSLRTLETRFWAETRTGFIFFAVERTGTRPPAATGGEQR